MFAYGSFTKWLSVPLRTKWLWVRIPLPSLKLQTWRLLRARSSLTFRRTLECRFTLKLVRDMIITHNQIDLIQRHSGEHSLERMLEEMKVISKYVKETENVSLKNNILFGEWLSNARNRYKYIKIKDLPQQFDKWVHKECGIVKQTMYNYINLYKLMCIAPKLCGCRVSMTHFIDNHKTLMTYFQIEEKTPWKHQSNCKCNDCNVYFFRMEF